MRTGRRHVAELLGAGAAVAGFLAGSGARALPDDPAEPGRSTRAVLRVRP